MRPFQLLRKDKRDKNIFDGHVKNVTEMTTEIHKICTLFNYCPGIALIIDLIENIYKMKRATK